MEAKRRRITKKTPDEHGQPLPRNWRHVGRVPLRCTKRNTNKIDEWLESPASLPDKLPLTWKSYSEYLKSCRLPDCVANNVKCMRSKFASLKKGTGTAHSFLVKDGTGQAFWKSLSAKAMATYYEDSVLHLSGRWRMEEWWQKNGSASTDTGCALTFWYALDDSTAGSFSLPDAISA